MRAVTGNRGGSLGPEWDRAVNKIVAGYRALRAEVVAARSGAAPVSSCSVAESEIAHLRSEASALLGKATWADSAGDRILAAGYRAQAQERSERADVLTATVTPPAVRRKQLQSEVEELERKADACAGWDRVLSDGYQRRAEALRAELLTIGRVG